VPWAATTEEGTPASGNHHGSRSNSCPLKAALPRESAKGCVWPWDPCHCPQEDRVRYFIGGQRLEFLALVFVQLQEQADMRQVDLDALVRVIAERDPQGDHSLETGFFGNRPCSGTLPSRDRCQWSCSRGVLDGGAAGAAGCCASAGPADRQQRQENGRREFSHEDIIDCLHPVAFDSLGISRVALLAESRAVANPRHTGARSRVFLV